MKINDLNGLLQEKSIEEQMDLVLEELEVAATEDRDPKEMTPDESNKDLYPADEHSQKEEVGEVVVKESQVAAGPELEKATELKNEATLEKAPTEMGSEIDNKDVYPSDEHSQKEEVGEVVVEGCSKKLKSSKTLKEKASYSDFDLMKILDENGYEASLDNLLILKEQLAEGTVVIEDALESDPVVKATEEKVEDTDKEAETGDLEKAEKPLTDDDDKEDNGEEKTEEDKKEETDDKVEELASDKSEDLEEGLQSIFSLIERINESLQNAAGPELGNASELKNEATTEKASAEMSSEKDNKDVYPTDEHSQKEEVGEVVVKESQVANGPELGNASELKNEATTEKAPAEMASEADNKDVYPADEHKQAEEVEGVVVKESEQLAAGPELGNASELKNEATTEKAPSTSAPSVDNKDMYPTNIHKQVEEVVEVVVEAAAVCKAKGIPATRANLIHECQNLMEEKAANVGDPAEKEYDVDEDIKSKEKTGTKATEKSNDNPAPTDLRESVNYTSIKEACLLDEGYFQEDSYTIQTSAEKQERLVEQISLLLARENMDPMYDELLKESIHAQRLNEAIIRKYSSQAAVRAQNIYNR